VKTIVKVLNAFFIVCCVNCQNKPLDLEKYIDGWEYVTTFKTYPSSSLSIDGKRARIDSGNNNLLVVELETKPILKHDAPTNEDLQSFRALFIELNSTDSLVSPLHLGNSRIVREYISMSPRYGVNQLDPKENIDITRIGPNKWRIVSQLEDFPFEGEFNFSDSNVLTSRHRQMTNEQ